MRSGVYSADARWVPTAIARQRLGVTKQRIYQLISAGVLASYTENGVVMVSVHSIEQRLRECGRR